MTFVWYLHQGHWYDVVKSMVTVRGGDIISSKQMEGRSEGVIYIHKSMAK